MTDVRDKILAAALAIADERGLAAVSMRSVAERVGLSAMALYPHVSSKEALLDGVVDLLLAEQLPVLAALPAGADHWTRLRAMAQGVRQLARRHPSAFSLLLARPSVTADAVRVTDGVYQVLVDAGVPSADVARVERLVSTFALGFAASEVNGRFSKGTLSSRGRRAQLPEDAIPAHYRLAEHLDQPIDWDAEFEADLDDLQALVEAIATRP
ncbi:TetR/AcrR family transcriptional regulator [Tenggerimyces flavus]|uniref:TetR/AcrR family transcriptional regulator n=1 Tax=Tenggerimyces flavus TaxID=1708749 RepID=A0ABV7Y407_9ACTN|nr:TetR family transcriptional regulator [Tenggerimyces flavus]MBM7790838.1 AcrR family transcriptional regulator [Tenggerimyces flavus]